jgi:hypothetical protein
MSPVSTSTLTKVIRLRNTTGTPQELWLEPLGDRVVLAPNVLYELTATDVLQEIDLSADGFTVYGWIIRVSAVADDGRMQTVWELPTDSNTERLTIVGLDKPLATNHCPETLDIPPQPRGNHI